MNIGARLLQTALGIFVVFSLGTVVTRAVRDSKTQGPDTTLATTQLAPEKRQASDPLAQGQPHKVIAYYFHGNARCTTCRKIEAYTRECLDSHFASQLKDGSLEWVVVNVEEPQNEHFVEDYQLSTRSVVLVDMQGATQSRWKTLDKVWEVIRDRDAFMSYVEPQVQDYLRTTS